MTEKTLRRYDPVVSTLDYFFNGYWFIAENAGLIADTRIEINGVARGAVVNA
ncbi:MAG TPA: hypothetical protein VJ508_17765 [Saprospiraceae bacterium]|nr:hypothetical protein [Saprospiraceae bacterium]